MSFEEELSSLKTKVEADSKVVKEVKESVEKLVLAQEKSEEERCKEKGGKWDSEKKSCEMPKESKEAFDQSILVSRFKQPMIHLESGTVLETLEQAQEPAFAPPAYAPPKYPAGLYPLPKLRALIEKLAKGYGIEVKGDLSDLLGKLGATQATTKEECEAKGGTWNPDEKTCKVSTKESLEALAVLPSETPLMTPELSSMSPKQFKDYMKNAFPNRWEEPQGAS